MMRLIDAAHTLFGNNSAEEVPAPKKRTLGIVDKTVIQIHTEQMRDKYNVPKNSSSKEDDWMTTAWKVIVAFFTGNWSYIWPDKKDVLEKSTFQEYDPSIHGRTGKNQVTSNVPPIRIIQI